MQNLFVGGSSDIAKCTAKLLNNVDNLSRQSSKNYKKNITIKNYSIKNIDKALDKIVNNYDNILIFNGEYSNSFLTNFDEKKFYDSLKINLITPLIIASSIIKKNKLKKNGSIYFISSIASKKKQKGNAYYSVAKNALELSAKILGDEQRLRNFRVNLISIGLVKNKMGLSTFKYLPKDKQNKIKLIKTEHVSRKIKKIIITNKGNLKKINL